MMAIIVCLHDGHMPHSTLECLLHSPDPRVQLTCSNPKTARVLQQSELDCKSNAELRLEYMIQERRGYSVF